MKGLLCSTIYSTSTYESTSRSGRGNNPTFDVKDLLVLYFVAASLPLFRTGWPRKDFLGQVKKINVFHPDFYKKESGQL